MTRKEWIEQNLPAYISNKARGGVLCCPSWYRELVRIDPGVLNKLCEKCPDLNAFEVCEVCWNMELNIKEERSKNMTRREFVIKNYGKEVEDTTIACGIHSCPGHYPKLIALDPSCNALCLGQPSCEDSGLNCMECWNREIPGTPNDEVPMPVIGGRFWTFVRENVSSNADLLVVGNFVIVALMRANAEIRVFAKDETLDLEYVFFYDPEKKSIRKLPKDWALEKKYPEIDFTIYWDEESMNRAKRGIVSDREYTNQYILLTKADNKKGE
jgi:hypothetical protein